jgi:type IV secretory pathway TrbD component
VIPETPVHQALVKIPLLLGTDPRLVFLEFLLVLLLTLGSNLHFVGIALAVAVLFLHPLLAATAKNDPQFIDVYLRHIRYDARRLDPALRAYFPAVPHFAAPMPRRLS